QLLGRDLLTGVLRAGGLERPRLLTQLDQGLLHQRERLTLAVDAVVAEALRLGDPQQLFLAAGLPFFSDHGSPKKNCGCQGQSCPAHVFLLLSTHMVPPRGPAAWLIDGYAITITTGMGAGNRFHDLAGCLLSPKRPIQYRSKRIHVPSGNGWP